MPLESDFTSALNALGPFESKPVVAIAVSGGADSMALALLAEEWAHARGGNAIALTVDHRLRDDSKTEAEQVGAWLAARKIKHRILTWEHDAAPDSGIPAAARAARYKLLSDWCRANAVLHLLVAHHAYDQAETVALRMERGIKGDGLAGIGAIAVRSGVRILRPLLDVKPDTLRSYLKEQGQNWVEDPSNQNLNFARNAMRQKLDDKRCEELCVSAKAAGRARMQKEERLAGEMAARVTLHPEGWAEWNIHASQDDNDDDIEIFSALIHTISANADSMRWEEAQQSLNMLKAHTQMAATLGGCYIAWSADFSQLIFMREQSAIKNSTCPWDGRFSVEYEEDREGLRTEALGAEDFLAIKQEIPAGWMRRIPRKVFLTLPAVKDLEGVVKLPHIDYRNTEHPDINVALRWMPGRPVIGHPFMVLGEN